MLSLLDIISEAPDVIRRDAWLYRNFDAIRQELGLPQPTRHVLDSFYPGGYEATSAIGLVGEFSWRTVSPVSHLVFSFWLDQNTSPSARRFLFRAQNTGTAIMMTLEIDASDNFKIIWCNDAGTEIVNMTSTAAVPTSGLFHICGYIDIVTPAVTVYEDGVLKAMTTTTLTAHTHLFTGHARWGINCAPLDGSAKSSFIMQELFIHSDPVVTDVSTLPAIFRESSLPKDIGNRGQDAFESLPDFYFTGLGPNFRNVSKGGQLQHFETRNFPSSLTGV